VKEREVETMENKKLYSFGKPNVFGFPQGFLGVLAGWLMGRLSVELNTWAVRHLDVKPADHVLEIGFGPGLGIAYISELATQGLTAGVDPSPVMMRQATKRNASAIKSGRVELREGAMPNLPYDDNKFDKVLSVNNVMLWPNPEASLNDVRRVLKTGGRIVITLCPRWAKTFRDVEDMAQEIVALVNQAGFTNTTVDLRRDLKPAGALTVIAYNE
jgi:ubiquinone/menaquinone biosynthesis C-methylase UbiE